MHSNIVSCILLFEYLLQYIQNRWVTHCGVVTHQLRTISLVFASSLICGNNFFFSYVWKCGCCFFKQLYTFKHLTFKKDLNVCSQLKKTHFWMYIILKDNTQWMYLAKITFPSTIKSVIGDSSYGKRFIIWPVVTCIHLLCCLNKCCFVMKVPLICLFLT